jgi:hypothetical protein
MGSVHSTGTVNKLWTDDYLSSLASEAEIQISSDVNCIYVRFPLNIVASQGIYNFLTDTTPAQRLTGIIRITWQGWTVHPVFQNQLRNMVVPFKPEEGDTISSRPTMYMRKGYGMNSIKFFPSPNLSIPYDSTDITTQTGITNNIIVSGWRIADPTGSTYRIPDYIREPLVRYYVMMRAYRKEGKGQNLDAAKYYEIRYVTLLGKFKKIISNLFASRTHSVNDSFLDARSMRPPRPSLPVNFGTVLGPYTSEF